MKNNKELFKILSLDGGGSLGVYTLGVLNEFEKYTGKKCAEYFDLIYGTSTGAIIGALLGLNNSVEEVSQLYYRFIPTIMKNKTAKSRSKALKSCANEIFQDLRFTAFKNCNVGIVATKYNHNQPIIFKNSVKQSYGLKDTFEPGFGCKISDAVQASASAYPFFKPITVLTKNQGEQILIDGGFVANNPTLFALNDALNALNINSDKIRILSIGVGNYPEKNNNMVVRAIKGIWPIKLLQKTLQTNTNTTELLLNFMYPNISKIRINESFNQRDYATDFLDSNKKKLQLIQNLGRESYRKNEDGIKSIFNKQL